MVLRGAGSFLDCPLRFSLSDAYSATLSATLYATLYAPLSRMAFVRSFPRADRRWYKNNATGPRMTEKLADTGVGCSAQVARCKARRERRGQISDFRATLATLGASPRRAPLFFVSQLDLPGSDSSVSSVPVTDRSVFR